ncbi:MAG TPA: ribosome assembly RNA-binding protein YhbY [Acidobacteriota bacterium]|nr:ribosome assembly RNA-binding protein YhbY [Acidobacteriota bacterium]
MLGLSGSQRKYLKGLAHSLKPVVQVGQHGLTEPLVEEFDRSINAHELIKVKFVDHKDERKKLAELMAERTASDLVGVIGNIAIFYRPAENPEDRGIHLP